MASGDAGEILRKIADLDSELKRMKRMLQQVEQDVRYIKVNLRH